jgi:hypothetical protein
VELACLPGMCKRVGQLGKGTGGAGGVGAPAGPPARRPAPVVEFRRDFFPVSRMHDCEDADRVRRLLAALLVVYLKKGGE